MLSQAALYRYTAFSSSPDGGNPAGVWIGEALPDAATMQRIAADVGFSETAFVAPAVGRERTVRYYSPQAEVSFCGHATIAAGVILGETVGEGSYRLATAVGEVPVTVRRRDAQWEASLVSVVDTAHEPAPDALVAEALAALHWEGADLDDGIPPARAYAGAWHLVLAVSDPGRLAHLDYDFDALEALMLRDGLTTLQLVWRERRDRFHARDPFPVGGVVEDPATGAAAALGGYLRDAGLISTPMRLVIHQGEAMGRPSLLMVDIPASGGVTMTGTAVPLDAAP